MRKLRTEEEIIATWKGGIGKPIVSICCITYNHEPYIEDAIEGFLIQETDFPFEILIHDDASTDGTTEIVRCYMEKYPNIIRVVIQTENQYSKNPIITPRFLWPLAKGEYFAMCEGDDYWVYPEKLRQQINAMEKNKACWMSFHPVTVSYQDGRRSIVANYFKCLSVISPNKIISGDGSVCPTPSLIFRREILDCLPRWFYEKAHIGDYYLQIFGSLNGGALYIPTDMAVYRASSRNSWSERIRTIQGEKRINLFEASIECMTLLDSETKMSFSKSISRAKSHEALSVAIFFFKKSDLIQAFNFLVISHKYNKLQPLRFMLSFLRRHVTSLVEKL